MPEYQINDDWVLKRVSKQSSSFSDWIKDLISSVTKSIQDQRPDIAEELKKADKELPDLVALEEQMKK